ncbi:MAG: hypothetical protein Q9217_006323 [Psora testacea]
MDRSCPKTNKWAVLIGINFYLKDKPLKGCVRDVEMIEHYLRAKSEPIDIDIIKFTITESPRVSHQGQPGYLNQLPTYENVVRSLARILEFSRPGDLVYVHFSGHGTRVPHTGALALVLFDLAHGSRLLHGQLLASVLERMTENGLLVTLVLDCCFSGSNLRHDNSLNTIRYTNYDPLIDAAHPFNQSDTVLADESWHLRNANAMPRWLVSPNYTILTACGPGEIAEEFEIETEENREKTRSGALSYFLLEALISLRRSGVEVTHSSLHQHLLVKFHTYWPRQTPMRRGNRNLSFFGKLRFESDSAFVPVFVTGDGRICLDAGRVHNVNLGDEYALYTFGTWESYSECIKTPGLKYRVKSVGCLTSDLIEAEAVSSPHQVETGWKARLLTQFSNWSIPVRITSDVKNEAQWIAAAEQRSSVHLHRADDEKPCLFHVICNASEAYEILDASHETITALPSLHALRLGAIEGTLAMLEHLAKFKRFESIENRLPSKNFEQSFTIVPNCETEVTGFYNVSHGGEWQFLVENLSDEALYLTIFDLRPSYQIKNLVSDSDGGFFVVQPREKFESSLEMEVPEYLRGRGRSDCTETIKFFITSKPICLPSEVLPEIPHSPENSGEGIRGSSDQLSRCLSLLEWSLRDAKDDPWNHRWASRNFLIRTSMK